MRCIQFVVIHMTQLPVVTVFITLYSLTCFRSASQNQQAKFFRLRPTPANFHSKVMHSLSCFSITFIITVAESIYMLVAKTFCLGVLITLQWEEFMCDIPVTLLSKSTE